MLHLPTRTAWPKPSAPMGLTGALLSPATKLASTLETPSGSLCRSAVSRDDYGMVCHAFGTDPCVFYFSHACLSHVRDVYNRKQRREDKAMLRGSSNVEYGKNAFPGSMNTVCDTIITRRFRKCKNSKIAVI